MAIVVVTFIAVLLASFALILLLLRQSPEEKSLDYRMQSIRVPIWQADGLSIDTAQWLRKHEEGLGSLEALLKHLAFSRKLQIYMMQANSSRTVSHLILAMLGLALAGYAIAWWFVPLPLIDLVGAAAMACVPYGILSFQRTRRIDAFNAVLAETIDMLARALRAGYSMGGAIEMLSQNAPPPAASEFGEVFKQQNLGLPLRDALLQLLERFPSLDLRVLVTAILVQKDTGGNLAEILDRTVAVIRERLRIQGEIRVQTAQGRLTGWILSALPVVMLVLINVVNPGYSSILLHDPFGRKLIYSGLAMLAIGSLLIRRIVNGIEV